MAFYYKCGKRFYIGFKDDAGKWQRKPMRVKEGRLSFKEGRPVLDEQLAKYLKNDFENALVRKESPLVNSKSILAAALLEEYKSHLKGIVDKDTIVSNCGSLKMFLDGANILEINHIREDKVRSFLDDRIKAGKINHITANNYIKYITTFINFAIRRNYLSKNPIHGIQRYKVDKEIIPRFLNKEEIGRMLKVAEVERLYVPVAVAVYAGLRLGEITRLKWADINLDKETLIVQKSKVGRPRTIPIHPNLKKLLTSSVFPFDFTNHLRVFKRIRRNAGLLDTDWYTLRHTFASQLVMSGVDIVTVSKLLGHADLSTTMIYSHLSQDHIKESINKLNF